MPLPKLSAAQIEEIVRAVAGYIDWNRQTYSPQSVPLDAKQRLTMQPFFPTFTLDSTRLVVLNDRRVANPSVYAELVKMGFEAASLPNFSEMAATTFVVTVVFPRPVHR